MFRSLTNHLTLPYRNLVRGPKGGLLRTPTGALAKDKSCCCDEDRPCSFFYGRVNAEDTHGHAEYVKVVLDDPVQGPSNPDFYGIDPDCCENLPLLYELPIRDWNDPTDGFQKFSVCPGDWMQNCYPYATCIGYDLDGETNFDIRASCNASAGNKLGVEGIAELCAEGCFETIPFGQELVWAVMIRGRGKWGYGPWPDPPVELDCESRDLDFYRADYRVTAPIGTVSSYSGTFHLTKCFEWKPFEFPFGTFTHPAYCRFPNSLTLYADVEPPP